MNTLHTPAPHPVTLDDCDREPIHIPGHVQPHGVLLAFDDALRLQAWSENAPAWGFAGLALDRPLDTLALPQAVLDAVHKVRNEMVEGGAPPHAIETTVGGRVADAVVHAHLGRVLLELEGRENPGDDVARFALQAHRAVDRLKRHRQLDALLQFAVNEIRALTGFDRVMAYRFRHDDSGDVVAEDVREDMEPFLGRRYPASDIPAQARRLYVLNTLRLIADVGYEPVPVLGRAGDAPLDMSHSVLRSVSPIHIEYLRNMGVGASMSISIVVQDRLWGLIACHHNGPRLVPHSLRMACDVIAQVLAATVASLDARERAERSQQAAALHAALASSLLHEDDLVRALFAQAEGLQAVLQAPVVAVVQQGRVVVQGALPTEAMAATLESLAGVEEDLVVRDHRGAWPAAQAARVGPWVGLLALAFDRESQGWILALRPEQVQTVRWGGRPEKLVRPGPLGPRLTPRGSFDEWRETVRDTAEPWAEGTLEQARALLAALHRAANARHAELERARTQMLAILGHDLRDPLHSIHMAAQALGQTAPQTAGQASAPADRAPALSQRIIASSGRMQRLIGQILDLSRLRTGQGLSLRPREFDAVQMLRDLVDEAHVAHPGVSHVLLVPERLDVRADPDRLGQLVANLLSNARHHGSPGHPITLTLAADDVAWRVVVGNVAPPIPEDVREHLFSPFKRRQGQTAPGAHQGLGLGLFIAHEIALGHGGTLAHHDARPEVHFELRLPLRVPAVESAEPWGKDVPAAARTETGTATPPAPSPALSRGAQQPGAGPERVLVVDDHGDSAESLCELLRLEGFEAVSAQDFPRAMELATASRWHAMVLDVHMPGKGGLEIAARVRKLSARRREPTPRLIALSGAAIGADALGDGPFDHALLKPLDIDALLRLLR